MIHTIKNYKWVIAVSVICILLGVLTFFTFINKSFVNLNEENFQLLLIFDLVLLFIFFTLIIRETYKVLKSRNNLNYEIDGLAIKLNNRGQQNMFGFTSKYR